MSDNEEKINSQAHQRLLQAVTNLAKSQHIRKPTRIEPLIEPDEFGLVKQKGTETRAKESFASGAQTVKVNDIVQVLKKSDKHSKTKNLLTNVRKTKKVLTRPLEKPAAERIKRQIGYENVKTKLQRWNAVVTKNRSSEAQVFPLQEGETLFIDTSAYAKPLKRSIKSDLQQKLMDIDAHLERLRKAQRGEPIVDEAAESKREEKLLEQEMTREELLAKRKELAYLRLRQSQMQSKARMQNKVKSKKYHKLLKRQKMKEQMKEFELLQKTNPEAALEKLNTMERNRIYERASLKHKNTGTWAKSLQMRAKYDKSVRKDLAEQLQISRELTKKKELTEDEENDGEEDQTTNGVLEDNAETDIDPFNPWTRVKSKSNKENAEKEGAANSRSWRKYWMERNENQKLLEEYEEDKEKAIEATTEKQMKKLQADNHVRSVLKNANKKKSSSSKCAVYENGWLVEDLEAKKTPTVQDIDSIFDAGEEKLQMRLKKKLEKIVEKSKMLEMEEKLYKIKNKTKTKMQKAQADNANVKELKDLEFKKQGKKKPIIDEELNAESLKKPKSQLNVTQREAQEPSKNKEKDVEHIDVTKLASVRLQKSTRDLQDLDNDDFDVDLNEADNELQPDHREQQINISEAFEDDDIVADFTAEKSDDTKLKDTELELTMPGWGAWAGAGISKEATAARKANIQRKRLILQLADKQKRADAKKPNVYINEAVSKDLRQHLVSDVPFPFTRVKDFESSVRAPVGRNFVPETAFRMLIRPEIRIRKGQVIEPMDEAELVKPAKRLRHEVDKRIKLAEQEKENMKKKGK